MDSRSRAAFLALIVAQAGHSIEEYVFRLFDVLAPARFIGGLLSSDLARGFAIANVALVVFGLWCYVARVHRGLPSARGLAWFWALLELGNGMGHSAFALARGGYFPGVATAPLLLGISVYLIARLSARDSSRPRRRHGRHGRSSDHQTSFTSDTPRRGKPKVEAHRGTDARLRHHSQGG